MSVALDLAPVPVAALTSRRERFRCEPYRAVLPARDCLARQARAKLPDLTHGQRMEIARCVNCALGAEVLARLAEVEEDDRPLAVVAGKACAVEGCAKPAERDGLCVKHYARQTERTRQMNRERAANEIAASLAPALSPAPSPAPAVERPAVVAAPAQPLTPEVSMAAPFSKAPCTTRGCKRPVGIVRANTPAWGRDICSHCRQRARSALHDGTTTEANLKAYLDGDRSALSSAKRASSPAPRKAPAPRTPAPVARPAATTADAVELSADTIQVTITLPSDVARAHRCALAVGGVAQLEQLVAAVLAVRS